ncbi:glycoside hydrolase family 24 protein, partial [Capnocytophaga catalasegens]
MAENEAAVKVSEILGIGKVKRIELEEKKCVCEERIRAFMRMLKIGEGTGELNIKGEKIDPQRGYRIAFGGNEITDFSKHPEKVYNGSSAAGAYQIMQYTWKWLKGERTIKNKKVYDEKGDYCKKYNIQSFDEESQDKLCLAILKHKREGILDLIMKGEIEMAVRKYASLEWASLTHIGNNSNYSFKGNPQPAISVAT